MHLRLFRLLTVTLLASVASLVFVVARASADPATEKAAQDLRNKAINEDALGMDYAAGIAKINQAVQKCGTSNCSAQLRAQLQQDLGVLTFTANNADKDKAMQFFIAALKIDPNLELAQEHKNGENEALWEDAKKQAGGGAPTPSGTGTTGGGEVPTGNFTHDAPTESSYRTPVPIYVEYTGQLPLSKVEVRYKGQGMSTFKVAPLKKQGNGWAGYIPCEDVVIGQMKYFVQGSDPEGNVETLGNSTTTFTVPIKARMAGEAPHLPGEPPPKMCPEKGDCPEGLVGCHSKGGGEKELKGEGDECEEDSECKSGTCKNSQCTAPEEEGGAKPGKFPRLWIGVMGQLDMLMLSSADDVCKLADPQATPVNTAGYYCTNPDGSDYPLRTGDGSQNRNLQLGKSDQVKGGLAPGNIRVMVSIDYAFSMNLLIGARLGYSVVNNYPGNAASTDGKTFSPFYAELRGTYLLGKDALIKPGLSPMVFLGAGVAEYDASVSVTVIESGLPGSKTVNAWGIAGPAFMSLGGGGRWLLSPKAALVGAVKLTGAFGGNPFLPIVSPELGVQLGF